MNEQPDEAIDDDVAPSRAASATPPAKTTRRKRPAGSLEARRRFEQERAVAVAKSRLNERRRRLRTIFDSGGDLPAAAIAVALEVIRQTHEATGEGPTWGHIGSVLGHRAPPSVEAIMLELTALGLVEHSPQPRSLRLTPSGHLWLDANGPQASE